MNIVREHQISPCPLFSLFSSTKSFKVSVCLNFLAHLVVKILYLQERLGEVPGHEDLRSGRNDQHLSSDTQQTRQTELVQGGH